MQIPFIQPDQWIPIQWFGYGHPLSTWDLFLFEEKKWRNLQLNKIVPVTIITELFTRNFQGKPSCFVYSNAPIFVSRISTIIPCNWSIKVDRLWSEEMRIPGHFGSTFHGLIQPVRYRPPCSPCKKKHWWYTCLFWSPVTEEFASVYPPFSQASSWLSFAMGINPLRSEWRSNKGKPWK